MKKFLIITIGLFSMPGMRSHSQDCNLQTISNIKGKWTRDADNVVDPEKTFSANQYNQLYVRLDKIALLYQEAYRQPMGVGAKWYRSVRGAALVKNGPVPYQFNSLFQGWYCNQTQHKPMLNTETGTWSYVNINNFGWFMTDQYDKTGIVIDGADTYLLPRKAGEWQGFPYYETSNKNSRVILITRTGQLPYKPVSRLQLLQVLKKKIETDYKSHLEAARRNNENTQLIEKNFNDRLKPIADLLNNSVADELQQPAIIGNNSIGFFKGFSTEEKGGRMLVSVNADYFNPRLPRYIPQLIVLYWSWARSGPAVQFKKEFEENFAVNKLKEMIDK
jgi:hypothetical protein